MASSSSSAAVRSRTEERIQQTLEWVAPHCDILERMDSVPPSAQVRGIWLRILERQLGDRGLLDRYHELLPEPRRSGFAFHHVNDLLLHAAVAGALVASPAELHRGMYEITRDNARQFTKSLMGRTLLKILARDTKRLCQQVVASRRQTCNYGSWEVRHAGDNEARIYLREEYVWMESYLLGAAVGTFEAVGDDVEAEAVMEDRFHGVHVIRWTPR